MDEFRISVAKAREALKNLSGDELAQFQRMLLCDEDLDEFTKRTALQLTFEEVELRESEGLERKASRLWHRHGDKIAIGALAALLGASVDDLFQ